MRLNPYLAFGGDCEEALNFYKECLGGKITMPLQDTFWGARFGMFTDRFGVKWMFNCESGSE